MAEFSQSCLMGIPLHIYITMGVWGSMNDEVVLDFPTFAFQE